MQTGLVASRRSVPPNGATHNPNPPVLTKCIDRVAGVGRELGVVSQPPAMRHVAHRDQRHAVPSCLLDPFRNAAFGDDLAEAEVAIEDEQGLGVDDGLAAVPRQDFAVAQSLQIDRQPDRAVGGMTAHVGENEVPRDRRRLVRAAARALRTHARGTLAERRGRSRPACRPLLRWAWQPAT